MDFFTHESAPVKLLSKQLAPKYTLTPIVPARLKWSNAPRRARMLTILVVVLLLLALGSFPAWPYSREWGYYPSSGLGLVVVILVILLLLGRI